MVRTSQSAPSPWRGSLRPSVRVSSRRNSRLPPRRSCARSANRRQSSHSCSGPSRRAPPGCVAPRMLSSTGSTATRCGPRPITARCPAGRGGTRRRWVSRRGGSAARYDRPAAIDDLAAEAQEEFRLLGDERSGQAHYTGDDAVLRPSSFDRSDPDPSDRRPPLHAIRDPTARDVRPPGGDRGRERASPPGAQGRNRRAGSLRRGARGLGRDQPGGGLEPRRCGRCCTPS